MMAAACLCVVLAAGMMPLKGALSGSPLAMVNLEFGSASRSGPMVAMAAPGDGALLLEAPAVKAAPTETPEVMAKSRPMRRPSMPEAARKAYHLTQQGLQMHREGEVDQAARSLEQAHEICQTRVGPNHPQTRHVALNLANIYGDALNRPMGMMRSSPGIAPGVIKVASPKTNPPAADAPIGIAAADAPREAGHPVQSLRARLDRKKYTEVQQRVVPMLALGLKHARTPEQRQSLIQALSELGPASGAAVGVLADRLERTEDEREQVALVMALGRMGPEARFALPTLNRLANGNGGLEWTTCQQARSLVGQLHGPAGRVGVADQAGLFSVGAVREAVMHFQSQAGRLEIFVEAPRPGVPSNAKLRLKQMGPQAIVVVMRRDQAELFPAETLTVVPAATLPQVTETLSGVLRAGEPDDALRAVYRLQPSSAEKPE
jgi:hypothetical protein